MRLERRKTRKMKSISAKLRACVSFPPDVHYTLEQIAKQKKVLVAWVIRDAAEKYIAERWPLRERAR